MRTLVHAYQQQLIRLRWRSLLYFLPWLAPSSSWADSRPQEQVQNCLSRYEVLAIDPLLQALQETIATLSPRADARILEDQLQETIKRQSLQTPPIWNSTEIQDLARKIQELLFQQIPEPALDTLRSRWILLLLAQHQWDVILPIVRKRDEISNESLRNLLLWQEGEARLRLGEFANAARLFDLYRPAKGPIQSWLSFRKMEIQFLQENSLVALDHLTAILRSDFFQKGSAPAMSEQLQQFMQAYAVKGQSVPGLFKVLAETNQQQLLGIASSCTLKTSNNAQDRALAFNVLLGLKNPDSFSLMMAGSQLEKLLIEPAEIESILPLLQSYTAQAQRHFSSTGASARPKSTIFRFLQTFLKTGDFLLKSRSIKESYPLLSRLESITQEAEQALPPDFYPEELRIFRARVFEQSQRFLEAAATYKDLALAASSPAQQRKFADQMLQSYGQSFSQSSSLLPSQRTAVAQGISSEQQRDQLFLDACLVYQNLVPDASQELSRCDLMLARKAMQAGDSKDARQKLWQIVYTFPDSVEAQTAAERLLELARNDPDELYLTSENLLKIRSYQTGPWSQKLLEMRRQTAYQRITQLASPTDQAEAYFFYAQKEKGTELASQSLLAAVRLDKESGRLSRAMDRLEIWLQDYPDSPLVNDRLLELLSLAEKSLQIKRARQYLRWTEGKSWTTAQQDFLQEKACSFDLIENPLLALGSCQKLPDYLPQGPELRLRLARALAFGGYSKELNEYSEKKLLSRNDFSVNEKMEILDLLRKVGSLTPSRQDDVKSIMTNYYLEQTDQLGPHSRRVLGGLAYQGAQSSLPAFMLIPIHGTRSDELITAIQAKKQAFDELEALYNKVLQTKDPHWGSSALCDLALAAENFADTLQRIPEIEGLDRKKLMAQVTSQVAAWRAKAKSYAGAASKTIEKFGTLHHDNRRIIQEANRLKDTVVVWNDWLPPLEVVHAAH